VLVWTLFPINIFPLRHIWCGSSRIGEYWQVPTGRHFTAIIMSWNAHYKISQFYRRTNSIGVWLEVRRWFFYQRHHRRITSVGFPFVGDSPFCRYIGRKNKKTICGWFYRQNLRAKKKDSRLKYTDGFLFRRWYCDWLTETICR